MSAPTLAELVNDPQEPQILLSQYFGHPVYWPLYVSQAFAPGRGWFPVRAEYGINNLRQLTAQGVTALHVADGEHRCADFTIAELGIELGLLGSYM